MFGIFRHFKEGLAHFSIDTMNPAYIISLFESPSYKKNIKTLSLLGALGFYAWANLGFYDLSDFHVYGSHTFWTRRP